MLDIENPSNLASCCSSDESDFRSVFTYGFSLVSNNILYYLLVGENMKIQNDIRL